MLVNGVHLLPDVTGILAWPKERLLVLADPHLDRAGLTFLAGVLRQRQPRKVICLGAATGAAEREAEDLRKLVAAHDWLWIAEDGGPAVAAFGGETRPELAMGGLTFRHRPRPDAEAGEIAGSMRPKAGIVLPDGPRLTRPCFLTDGRRAILPAFGSRDDGLNVLDAAFRPLFRRAAFTALMLGDGRLLTIPRAKLAGEAAPGAHPEPGIPARRAGSPGGGRRMNLFSQD